MNQAAAVSPSGCPVSHRAQSFDPFSENYLADPYEFFGPLRHEEPVFFSPKLDYWVVTRYEDVKQCFRDQENFSAAITLDRLKPLYASTMERLQEAGVVPTFALVNEDPPDHQQRRRRLMRAFTPGRIKALEPSIRALCNEYIDRFVRKGHADLVSEFVWEIPALVIFNFTGVPDEEVSICKDFATSHALFNWGYPSEEEQNHLGDITCRYWQYAKMHVARLSQNLGDDFISEMIRASKDTPGLFDENYLAWMTMNFTYAGHETTTAASGNALRALLEHLPQWDELCNDPSLIPNAVEECLRYVSSVIAWRRVTRKPVNIGGVDIPEGAKLLIISGSANRDEEKFENSEAFDVHRRDAKQHLAFGFGAHLCMGAPLARLEMRIMLEELTRRLPHMRLVPDQPWTYSPNTSFRGPKSLLVEWDPTRNPIPSDRVSG